MVSVLHMRVLDGKLEGADSVDPGCLGFEMTVLISLSLFFFWNVGESVVIWGSEGCVFFFGRREGWWFRYECFFLERVERREKIEVTMFFSKCSTLLERVDKPRGWHLWDREYPGRTTAGQICRHHFPVVATAAAQYEKVSLSMNPSQRDSFTFKRTDPSTTTPLLSPSPHQSPVGRRPRVLMNKTLANIDTSKLSPSFNLAAKRYQSR